MPGRRHPNAAAPRSGVDHPRPDPGERVLPTIDNLAALFFDFDGVVLESATIKEDAFAALFADLPEHRESILDHHRRNLGVSRFEKFEWIYRELLGRTLEPAESDALGRRFSSLVRQRLLDCPLVPGALQLLEALRDRARCFVVSGTPTEELREIVRLRGLEPYFVEVWGSPPGKAEIFRDLMSRHELAPAHVLAIGDGRSDLEAALETGVAFVARSSPGARQDWASACVPRVSSLAELVGSLGLVPQR
jgi:phosphoglycolate phosphatase-like HAD superfamily hydrolase